MKYLFVFILLTLTLWSCKKLNIGCSENKTFCTLIDDQEFDATGTLIDNFLANRRKNKPDKNLDKLKDWLECKSCVDKVEIICNSSIYTLPPQSELSVDFISNGQTETMIMDILMSETLKFRAYH